MITSTRPARAAGLCFLVMCLLSLVVPLESHAPQYRMGCAAANPYDYDSDSQALQNCLDGGGRIDLISNAYPGYLIDVQLNVTQDYTYLRNLRPGRVVLRAMENLNGAILRADNKSNFTILHITLTGRADPNWLHMSREDLLNQNCGQNGFNATFSGSDYTIDDVESRYAVCGTGLGVGGSGFEVKNSYIHDNGWPEGTPYSTSQSWADGMTVDSCDGCWIHDNVLEDNTDVDLVVGGGHNNGVVENNEINNIDKYGFAGIHVGWFPGGGGDHSGMTYQNNVIRSAGNKMAFGLIAGFEPWWDPGEHPISAFVSHAGTIVGNDILGAVVNLAISGIGDGYISGNVTADPVGYEGFGDCPISEDYTAHMVGSASLQGGWSPVWYFRSACGYWNPNLPQPDNAGAIAHSRHLLPNEQVTSDSGNYHLYFQSNGVLTLFDSSYNPVWQSPNSGGTAEEALMQEDGNFVIYLSGHDDDWSTGTASPYNLGAYFVVQSDGNLVLYHLSGSILWSRW